MEKEKQKTSIRRAEIQELEKLHNSTTAEKRFLHEKNTSPTTRTDIASEILAFEHYCEQRCTDEEGEESDEDLSDQDSIELEDIMEEISGEEEEWVEY